MEDACIIRSPADTGQPLPVKWLHTLANSGGTGNGLTAPKASKSISNVNESVFSSGSVEVFFYYENVVLV